MIEKIVPDVEKELFNPAEQVIFISDPGTDKDDLEALVGVRGLGRKIQLKAVVTAVGWPDRRASLARYVLNQLRMGDTPVTGGSPLGKTDRDLKDYENEQFSQAEKAGNAATNNQKESSNELFLRLLQDAPAKSITFNLIASHTDLHMFLNTPENRELFAQKVKKVVMMGGAVIQADATSGKKKLIPDQSNNYTFDKSASAGVFEHLQEMNVPIVTVSRTAVAQVGLEPAFYDQLVTESHHHPVAEMIKDSAKKGIEALWQKATAPAGSPERHGLPDDRDRNWFLKAFCGGIDTQQTRDQEIWSSIQQFLPYDYLATLAIVPEYFSKYFDPTEVGVNGTTHLVVDKVKNPAELKQLLKQNLLDAFAMNA